MKGFFYVAGACRTAQMPRMSSSEGARSHFIRLTLLMSEDPQKHPQKICRPSVASYKKSRFHSVTVVVSSVSSDGINGGTSDY